MFDKIRVRQGVPKCYHADEDVVVKVKSLILTDYRNHENLSLKFGDGINIIVGGNALGKTNILESIYFTGKGRSFKGTKGEEIVRWGQRSCRVGLEIEERVGVSDLVAYIENGKKVFQCDGKRKRLDVGVVLFLPEDISIFRGEPSVRREFLDRFIFGVDGEYKKNLKEYQRVLSQRNRILKEGQERGFSIVSDELLAWTERLVEVGVRVISKRNRWVDEINRSLTVAYGGMGGVGNSVNLIYKPHVYPSVLCEDAIRREFEERLLEREGLEKIRGVTVVGPHRDDWTAEIDGKNIISYGSQGQKRVVVLSLKVVEMDIIRESLGEEPILMLDDVISELDDRSAKKLLSHVEKINGQVFITSTQDQFLLDNLSAKRKVFRASESGVKEVQSD